MQVQEKHLHIISFTVPYPANYGGAIDVFEKIKALHDSGVSITLHCFLYDRLPAKELSNYTQAIYYYKRKQYNIKSWWSSYPYIIASRRHPKLLQNILENPGPILMEGIHTTYYLDHPMLSHLPKFIRMHNNEANYYKHLAKDTRNPLLKWYYSRESKKIQSARKSWSHASHIFCISKTETTAIKDLGFEASWLPAFHSSFGQASSSEKNIPYLYHGDLTIHSNLKIALQLAEVFKQYQKPLTLAGRMHQTQINRLNTLSGIELIPNPDREQMLSIQQAAQCHLVFASHAQGVKLKLIHSALTGAEIWANTPALMGSGLEEYIETCTIDEVHKRLRSEDATYNHPKLAQVAASLYDNIANGAQLWQTVKSLSPDQ